MTKANTQEMERRESLRLEKTLPVRFALPEGPLRQRNFEALSRNIAEGGIFIETDIVQDEDFTLDKDSAIHLEIELLGQGQNIKPRGQIAWISKKSRAPHKRRSGIGIKFMQITADEKRAVSMFISKEMLSQGELIEKELPLSLREEKSTDRQRRNLQILDSIRKNRLISRAEISKLTNINIVTVSNYIDTYLKKGLVFERGLDISSGGRRPELIEINPQYGYVLGVDLGHLNVSLSLMQVVACDFTTRIKAQSKDTRQESVEESIDVLKDLVADVLSSEKIDKRKVRGIGMGLSGVMDKFGGTVRNPLNGEVFANYVTIKKELEREFSLPVFIENSANCALSSEKWAGSSLEVKSAENILYLFSESQCAIMLKSELYSGSSKSAGQINLSPARNGKDDLTACWEIENTDCVLRLTRENLEQAFGSADKIEQVGKKVGAKIAYLVNIFNPQVVVIGNYFRPLGESFLEKIRYVVSHWAFRENAQQVRIIPSSLAEEAVAIGAASLVIESACANI